jgi:hypothetical protein
MSDLQNFRDMLDRAELSHTVYYVGTDHIQNKPNIAIHSELYKHEGWNVVIEFDPDGNFVMFDVEKENDE